MDLTTSDSDSLMMNSPSSFVIYPKGALPRDLPDIALLCIPSFMLLLLETETPGALMCKRAFCNTSG